MNEFLRSYSSGNESVDETSLVDHSAAIQPPPTTENGRLTVPFDNTSPNHLSFDGCTNRSNSLLNDHEKISKDCRKQSSKNVQGRLNSRRRNSINMLLSNTRALSISSSFEDISPAKVQLSSSPQKLYSINQGQWQRRRRRQQQDRPKQLSNVSKIVSFEDQVANFSLKHAYDYEENEDIYGYERTPLHDEDLREDEAYRHRTKRRRFERRNSKTPAMLMAVLSPILTELHNQSSIDSQNKTNESLFDEKPFLTYNQGTSSPLRHSSRSSSQVSDDDEEMTDTCMVETTHRQDFDSGLEVAQDLVIHLQKRWKVNS